MSVIVTIKDRSGRTLLYGTVDNMTVKTHELEFVLTKIHKPCILEEERGFCCDDHDHCSSVNPTHP